MKKSGEVEWDAPAPRGWGDDAPQDAAPAAETAAECGDTIYDAADRDGDVLGERTTPGDVRRIIAEMRTSALAADHLLSIEYGDEQWGYDYVYADFADLWEHRQADHGWAKHDGSDVAFEKFYARHYSGWLLCTTEALRVWWRGYKFTELILSQKAKQKVLAMPGVWPEYRDSFLVADEPNLNVWLHRDEADVKPSKKPGAA